MSNYAFNYKGMNEQYKKEIQYLSSLITSVQYAPKAFTIVQSDGKYIFGMTSVPGKEIPLSKILEYKTLYDTLVDLDEKIKFSLETATGYSYSPSVIKDFDMLKKSSGDEWMAYYHIENAVFRTSSMWDILAQFYRVRYGLVIDFDRVNYKRIFDPTKEHCIQFKGIAETIHAYLNEDDNTDCEGEWHGNHEFVSEYRNKMTHRNSPNVSVASNLDFNLKLHPTFILKRVIEDYVQAFKFISDIIAEAMEESRQIFETSF